MFHVYAVYTAPYMRLRASGVNALLRVSGDLAQRARARELDIREFIEKPVMPTPLLAAFERQCCRPR